MRYVEQSRRLLESGNFDSSAIAAWAALEGALEGYVADTGAPIAARVERQTTA